MKQHIQRRIVAIAVFTVLYIVLFPLRLTFEPVVQRAWVHTSDEIHNLPPLLLDDDSIALRASEKLYFVDRTGSRIFSAGNAAETSIGDGAFARVEQNRSITLYGHAGLAGATLKETGLPWFSAQSLFILSDTGTALSAYTASGEIKWHFEADNPITALAALPNGDSFVGLVDGRVMWLDEQGGIRASQVVGNGRRHVVYNLLWLEQRKELVALVDLDPQSLLILKPHPKSGASAARLEKLVDTIISQDFRTPVFLGTSTQNNTVFIEQPSGIGLVSADGRNRDIIDLGGTVLSMGGIDSLGLLVAAVENESGSAVLGFMTDGRFLFKQSTRGSIDDLALDKKGRVFVSSGTGMIALDFQVR